MSDFSCGTSTVSCTVSYLGSSLSSEYRRS